MKRLQIMIEEELDRALEAEAAAQRTSKAALIRRWVRAGLQPFPSLESDPLAGLVGSGDFAPADIDEVVHGR